MLIDTHCHINMLIKENFDIPLEKQQLLLAEKIITDALQKEVKIIINVGTNLIESHNSLLLAKQYSCLFAAIGIHPNDLTNQWKKDLKEMTKWLEKKEENKIVAIGEIGLDSYRNYTDLELQKTAFREQIEHALKYNLPIIVHTRKAPDETLTILHEYKKEPIRGIIHCFSEDSPFAKEAISLGFLLGIGGPLTYPANDSLRALFSDLSLDSIVLETDAPFLPPQAMRGKKNYPAEIFTIAQFLAKLQNKPFELIAEKTTTNAKNIFKL